MSNSCVKLFYEDHTLPGFAGAERCTRVSQVDLNSLCERVSATEHAPRDPFRRFEDRHGLAKTVERGARVLVERLRVNPPHLDRDVVTLS